MKVYFCGSNFFQQFPQVPQICRKLTEVYDDTELENLFNSQFITLYYEKGSQISISGYFRDQYCSKTLVDCIPDIKIVSVCDKFAILLTTNGSVIKLDLSNGYKIEEIPNFLTVERLDEKDNADVIKGIKCSDQMTVAITDLGYIYNVPNRISSEIFDIKDFCVGREHCLVLQVDGSVLSFGNGRFGQLGHNNLEDYEKPTVIEALMGIKIVKVSAGYWHSVALSDQGDIYSWGWNNNGQLGSRDESSEVQAVPKVIDFENEIDVNVRTIACGAKHTLALLDDNKLYGCGWNKYGQLGITRDDDVKVYKMVFIHDFGNIEIDKIDIQCGNWSSIVLLK